MILGKRAHLYENKNRRVYKNVVVDNAGFSYGRSFVKITTVTPVCPHGLTFT